MKGASFIYPVWRGMVHWHSVANADYERARTRKEFETMFRARPGGEALLAEFETLDQREAA